MFLPSKRVLPASSGFTLVELITSMIILSIVATVGMSKFFDSQSFSQRGFFDELINSVRYAQKVAIGSHCEVQIQISANSYSLKQPTESKCGDSPVSFPTSVSRPSGDFSGTVPDGVSISGSSFIFDAAGAPSITQTISVGSRSFRVHSNTGFVEKL